VSDSDATAIGDAEREALLDRVNSQGATIGATVPDEIEIDGDAVDLSAFIVETRKVDTVPPALDRKVTAARESLRSERERRVERLETEPIDRETAEALAEAVIGIDRALNALEGIRRPGFADEHHADTLAGHERWLAFVDQVR
jgi:regulator of protease activity HflC (stomatin/prohibitin superfamily)